MGNQTQTALPKSSVPEGDPARPDKENGPEKSRPVRRRKRMLTPPSSTIRPAFMLDSARRDDEEGRTAKDRKSGEAASGRRAPSAKRKHRTGTRKKAAASRTSVEIVPVSEEESGAVTTDETVGTVKNGKQHNALSDSHDYDASTVPLPGAGDNPDSGDISDPDLIMLLEQLSETIDTANQVLSEAPPATGAVEDEYAAASEPVMPERPAPPPVTEMLQQRSNTGLTTMTVAGLAVLLAATGSFLWFKDNPWLLDGVPTRKMTATITKDTGQVMVKATAPLDLNRPIPAMPIPLPSRKSQTIEAVARTASLGAETAVPTLPPEPKVAQPPVAAQAAADPAISATPVTGPAGQAIDLGLAVPENSQNQEVSIMVQGVPEEAHLSAGNKIGGGTWVLEEKHLHQLALVTPASFPPKAVTLDVVMVKSDGKIPESRSIEVVVQQAQPVTVPVANKIIEANAARTPATVNTVKMPGAVKAAKTPAAAATVATATATPVRDGTAPVTETTQKANRLPVARLLSAVEETRFLNRGKELLELGDVASARLILEHAARRDSTRAMTALAKTYDPEHLAKLGVRGVKPDINQANAWYERASRKVDR